MIWAAIGQKDRINVVILDGRQNAQKYTDTFQSYLIPFVACNYSSSWIFQQDTASIHTALHIKAWFQEKISKLWNCWRKVQIWIQSRTYGEYFYVDFMHLPWCFQLYKSYGHVSSVNGRKVT